VALAAIAENDRRELPSTRCLRQKGTEGKLVMRGLLGPSLSQLRHRMRAPTSAARGGELADGSRHSSGGKQRGEAEATEELRVGKTNGLCPLVDAHSA
jgi:hypothetical protein